MPNGTMRSTHVDPDMLGWFGTMGQLTHVLRTVGADREGGGFRTTGVASFLDANEEVSVTGDAQYFVNGEPRGLATLLRSTSYGLGVVVIG